MRTSITHLNHMEIKLTNSINFYCLTSEKFFDNDRLYWYETEETFRNWNYVFSLPSELFGLLNAATLHYKPVRYDSQFGIIFLIVNSYIEPFVHFTIR